MVTGSDLESSEKGVKLAEEGEGGFGKFSIFFLSTLLVFSRLISVSRWRG